MQFSSELFRDGIFDPQGMQNLGPLADPKMFSAPLEIANWSASLLLEKLELMILIRTVEEEIAKRLESGMIRCPCHLVIGQEAIATGISHHLRKTDRVFGGHRSHSHYLALGGSLDGMTAEVLGKLTGCSRGFGGSMHLYAPEQGFYGSVPIVGATIPIAVGAGLAIKMDRTDAVAVSYFGDGTTEEGIFHESLNLAACHKLPVLFVAENNLYSSHLDIKLRQPTDIVSRFALAHQIPTLLVDGNDLIAVADAAKMLIEHSRNGGGPGFMEVVTFRHRGHVGPNEDVDVGVRRTPGELATWKTRDPIKRLCSALENAKAIDDKKFQELEHQVRQEVIDSFVRAEAAPYPPISMLHEAVFAGGSRG